MFAFDSMYDTMTDVITVTGSVLGGLIVGYIFVGLFVYKPLKVDDETNIAIEESDKDEEDIELDEKAKELLEFQDSGYDTLSDMKSYPIIKDKFEHLKTSFIELETPEGLCKMNYDDSVESFTYYCDNKSISYKTLDAVARQYAIKYNCKNVCVNYKEEYEKAKKRLEDKQTKQQITIEKNISTADIVEDKPNKVEEQRSPFAKLKNYKTVDQPSIPKTNKTNTENSTEGKNIEEQDVLVITKANKFRFIGLIKDFVQPNPNPNTKPDSYKNINYSSFKQLMSENKSTTM